jgi:CRP/FNR family cyclic AMP-dependent transcriptional regulator
MLSYDRPASDWPRCHHRRILKAVSLFSALSKEEIAALADAAIVRTYPKNTILVTEGETSDSLYVILSGRVKVFVSDEHGKDLVINVAGPGEYFGELALDEGPRSASVATLEPSKMAVIANDFFANFSRAIPRPPSSSSGG